MSWSGLKPSTEITIISIDYNNKNKYFKIMSTLLQFLALIIIISVVYAIAYKRGKTIKERELKDMEIPELSQQEQDELRKLNMLDKIFGDDDIPDSLSATTYEQVKYGDDYDGGFTGDISKSSKTETEKDAQI